MSDLLTWPEPRCEPIGTVSYSEWARLRVCPLKAAFARDPGTRHWDRGSIWSAVGNARHHLVEEVEAETRAGLTAPSTAWVRARWDTLLSVERDRLAQQWSPATVPPVKQWPDTVYVRTRLARDLGGGDGDGWPDPAARPLVTESSGAGTFGQSSVPPLAPGTHLVEVWLRDPVHQLHGRVDRLEHRGGELAVVDLKSGIGSSAEESAARHRDQMIFYAGLVQASYQQWPRLELQPAAGPDVAVPYGPAEVEQQREAAAQDREDFNAALAAGRVADAARPGAATCGWCPFQVVCPALTSNWGRVVAELDGLPSRAVSLAIGLVQTLRRDSMATDLVIAQPVDLTVPAGEVSVTRLPAGLQVEPGDAVAVAGAELAGGSRVLRARWDSRIRIESGGAAR